MQQISMCNFKWTRLTFSSAAACEIRGENSAHENIGFVPSTNHDASGPWESSSAIRQTIESLEAHGPTHNKSRQHPPRGLKFLGAHRQTALSAWPVPQG